MKLGLNDFSDYSPPRNQDHLGPNFMYFGFVPAAPDNIHHGIEVCTLYSVMVVTSDADCEVISGFFGSIRLAGML